MELLTIFTPTWNREKKLKDTYDSLKKQNNKNFIWLIVDDGSSDNTEEEVKIWQKESDFRIIYKKKKNGGKHTAYNYALQFLETKYVYLSLDSDDTMYADDSVDKIIHELRGLKNEVGLITLCTNSKDNKNDFLKKYEIEKLYNKSLSYAYANNLFKAEGRMILRSDYVKKFKYPEIQGEYFFTEAYTYYQMDGIVKWTDILTCYSEYLADGYTASIVKLFVKNPVAWYMYNEIRAKKTNDFLCRLKYYVYYVSFALLSKKQIFKKELNYLLIVFVFPISLLGVFYLKAKGKNTIKRINQCS